jgi:CDP-paratose 2-epimerase
MMVEGKKILITGGLGFIGLNAVEYFSRRNQVYVVDDGSRMGGDVPLAFLKTQKAWFSQVDISQMRVLQAVYKDIQPDIILHLAAQVAVTFSITHPVRDFFSNAQGTLNLLELARQDARKPIFLYASTNKVYGQLKDQIVLKDGKYHLTGREGYNEETPLSFQTPYGCSKGAADQYVLDYGATYGIPSVCFRQSCIYGPHQYGSEDQGWVAWFAIAAMLGKPLTVYGDGCQVRDVLFVHDLIDVYERAVLLIDQVKGQAFNIGGGPGNTLSINELIAILQEKTATAIRPTYAHWRLGDQKVFICDIAKAGRMLDWRPSTSPQQGIDRMMAWMRQERAAIVSVHGGQLSAKRVDVSIVIPARNEEESLPKVLDEVKILLETSPSHIEVIVVNDYSTDRTADIVRQYSFATLVNNPYNSGKGLALRAGFEAAAGEYIAMMDADFSHNAADLAPMIEDVRRHRGLVVGSRITGGSEEYTRVRAFGNIILTWFFGFVHGRYLSDALNGFKIFHRDVFRAFVYTSAAFEIEIELLVNTLRLGRPITEYHSRERSRAGGKLKSSVVKHGTLFMTRIIHEKFRRAEAAHG